MRQCVSEANGGWWHTDQYYTLEQTSEAEGAIQPQCCLSALWYTLGEREVAGMGGEVGFDGYMLLKQRMAAGPVCERERETVHRKQEQEKKHVAFEGLTFICGTMSYFAASHRQFFVCAWGFLAHISFRCKWTLPRFCLIKRESRHGRGTVCLSSHTDIFAHLWACSKVAI